MEDNDSMYEPKFSSADEELLHASRNGHVTRIQEVLDKWQQGNGEFSLDINCKGKQKSNRGWTPLHLGAYFGHLDVVQLLLENGADVNIVNSVGDTPLHRAAHTGREAVVTILLQYGADVSLVNSEGLLPRNVARTGEIIRLIEATENHESRKQEEELLEAASQGKIDTISRLLKKSNPPNVNCTDRFGNTALHIAALRGQKEVSVFLLQNGINTNIKNKNDQLASDMTQSQQMKQLLGLQPVKSLQLQPQRCEGLLLKKSRILGFRPVWVILDRGVLSYFENRGDASTGTKRKGVKYLDEAKVSVPIVPSLDMKIAFSDGTTHTLSADPVNGAHVTKQKWINALKEHIGYSTHYIHWGKLPSEYDEDIIPLGTMQDALKTSQAHQKLLEKQVHTLSAMIKEPKSKAANKNNQNLSSDDGQLQNIQAEIETLLQSSRDMCCSLAHCMTLFSQQEEIRQLQLKEEMEKCRVLQEALHALATEHHELERSISSRSRKSSMRYYDTDDDEFYECDEDGEGSPGGYESIADTFGDALSVDLDSQSAKPTTKPWGRTCLPVPMFSRNDFSFWSILKQCIGKELSKITMPVIFNEPLSFIQRISEYMEYSSVLEKACHTDDPVERMQYVAAFAISAISSNWERIGKPFNPLLGETYELDRPDMGFRLVGEQVSHHPPVSAFHVDSQHYRFHGSINPKLKFWGKSVEINPKGMITLELLKYNEVYTWQNVNCCVHNVIVGKLWVEHYGTMEVINHKTKWKAVLNFKQGGWFGKDLHKVEGFIFDSNKKKLKAFYGNWVLGLYGVDADIHESFIKSNTPGASPSHSSFPKANGASARGGGDDDDDDIPTKLFPNYDLGIPGQACLWQANRRPSNSHQYFSFTTFAMALNELGEETQNKLAPTDSRLRPDIRHLEEGHIDGAAEEKNRLEEKQRAARKDRRKKKEEWTPVWFKCEVNPYTGKEDWLFQGQFWKRNWSSCPNIF